MQRTLYMRLAAIIPSAVVAALIFTFLIARPIRQLDNAIRRLGSADLTTPVSVSGPGDLVYLGERLDWLRRRLVELEAQKVKFMRAVSHELKTPLTALREGAALLHDGSTGELSEEQRSVARILFQNSVQLQKLIEDLLNYQRFQSSDVPLRCEEFDLAELARQVAIDHDLAARARGIRFDFSTRRCPVSADRSHIRTVIDNLYTNAVKYSPHDSQIRIRVSPGQQLAVLEVQDAGPGVPEDERELIFEPFYQGRIPPEGPVKGSGLGLAIARELAAEHDGQLTLSSNGNQGTVFRLELPRSQAAQHLLVRQ